MEEAEKRIWLLHLAHHDWNKSFNGFCQLLPWTSYVKSIDFARKNTLKLVQLSSLKATC